MPLLLSLEFYMDRTGRTSQLKHRPFSRQN